jgi:hypothetical protein
MIKVQKKKFYESFLKTTNEIKKIKNYKKYFLMLFFIEFFSISNLIFLNKKPLSN